MTESTSSRQRMSMGTPNALKRFVDAAHARGLGVVLDVVYNHFGPDGNYLPVYSDQYLTDRHPNEWGQAINYDGPGSAGVRDFVVKTPATGSQNFVLMDCASMPCTPSTTTAPCMSWRSSRRRRELRLASDRLS